MQKEVWPPRMASQDHNALKRKIAAFDQLQLSPVDDNNDSFDEKELARKRQHRKFFARAHGEVAAAASKPKTTCSRSSSIPRSSRHDGHPVVKETPAAPPSKVVAPERSESTSLEVVCSTAPGNSPLTTATTTSRPKRRRSGFPYPSEPPADGIFSGMAFYYIPNDDIAPARRIRISKARRSGAVWTRDMANATHAVVDRSISFRDVEETLARQLAGRAKPVVVNENYPLDCIQFRQVLDPNQKKYFLRGQELSSDLQGPSYHQEGNRPVNAVCEKVTTLPLKPQETDQTRWDYVPPPGTRERSGQSSHIGKTGPGPIQPAALQDSDSQARTVPRKQGQQSPLSVTGALRSLNQAEQPTSEEADELTQYISMMQEFRNLPLDIEDEHDIDSVTNASDEEDLSSLADERPPPTPSQRPDRKTRRKEIRFEERFVCNTASTKDANSSNPNARTIEVLEQMLRYYERINDQWRTQGYRKAISTLKRQKHRITTEEEAFRLPAIGRRIAQKIEEIVTTDRLQRLEHAQNEAADVPLQLFLGIYGVGNRQAQQWIAQGLRTLNDVRQRAKLSANQAIGIEHYKDLHTRIPRREIEALGEVVERAAAKIDPESMLILGGSYRRGADSSGDIDLIVTKPGTTSTSELAPFLSTLVAQLQADGFLVACLASSRPGGEGSKWHGCCVLPRTEGLNSGEEDCYRPVWRRVDFLLVPEAEIGAALIYFTGNDIFNRSMRLLASRKGMRLNQRGLYRDVMRGPQRARVTEGELVEGKDERKIFEILGVKWREPHERWC